jgi:signal transduction histidine kinase
MLAPAVQRNLLILVSFLLGLANCLLQSPAANSVSTDVAYPSLTQEWGVGSWIWTDRTFDKQTCLFWKSFEIPSSSPVVKARLRITADNEFRVLLDGRFLGRGSDWRWLSDFDVTWLLPPGRHVLAVEAFNDALKAGILAGFHAELADGQVIDFCSDDSWRVVPDGEHGWETRKHARPNWPMARIVGTFGVAPWDTMPRGVTSVLALRPIELRFWQKGWFQITVLTICGLVVALCLNLLAQLALQSRARNLLQQERARIARDIHDDLGAGLTQLVLLGELAQNDLADGSDRRAQIEQLCEKTRGLLSSMDEVVWAVNSRRDTLRDFAAHACKYAQTFLANTNIRCRLDVEPGLPDQPFDLPTRRNLFLAVKEAINNAARHSDASELVLRIHPDNGWLAVTVEDNGGGFEISSADGDRNGLFNMSQRMREVGGDCQVASKPGSGCKIIFRAPLARALRQSRRFTGWLKLSALPPAPAEQRLVAKPAPH